MPVYQVKYLGSLESQPSFLNRILTHRKISIEELFGNGTIQSEFETAVEVLVEKQ